MLRKKFIILIVTVVIIVFALVGIIYFINLKLGEEQPENTFEKRTLEESLQALTAPSEGEKIETSKEVIKSLTAPGKGDVSEDIIQELTSPQ